MRLLIPSASPNTHTKIPSKQLFHSRQVIPHKMLVESIIINNCSIFAEQYQPFEMIYYRLSEQYRKQEEFFSPCCQILHPYWMPVVFMLGLDNM